ncbi:MAG: hypothetical protein JNL50_07060 [Phycisphaerae bacterium]|nr:hypothetical protein [Phycisphaerae bacterium]
MSHAGVMVRLCVAGIAGFAGTDCRAQAWTWRFLDGLETGKNMAGLAAQGSFQGGYAFKGGEPHPVLWRDGQDVPIDLTPASRSGGQVFGMSADRQVGYAASPNVYHAAAWRGTPNSYVDLNPTGFWSSYAYAIRGDQIAGYGQVLSTGDPHAIMWTGPTDAATDLHNNTLATMSYAYATDGEYQGGTAAFRGYSQIHAALWHGSAETMIDLHPARYTGLDSWVLGMAPGVQVGQIGINPVLWHGTPESMVAMNPAGYPGGGEIHATDGVHHVGDVGKNGTGYAGIWMSDDPNSFVNLAELVSDDIWSSHANAIYSDSERIVVVGTIRIGLAAEQGVVWVQEIPAPCSAALMVMGIAAMGRRRRG